jgi:hypothetical protein
VAGIRSKTRFSTNGFQHRWGYVPVDMDISDINCPYEILYDIVDIQEIVTTRCDNYDIYIELENISHELCNIPVNNIPIVSFPFLGQSIIRLLG